MLYKGYEIKEEVLDWIIYISKNARAYHDLDLQEIIKGDVHNIKLIGNNIAFRQSTAEIKFEGMCKHVLILIIFFIFISFCQTTQAQTNSCSTNNTPCTKATVSDSARIISTTGGDQSLSVEDTSTLKDAIQKSQQAHKKADEADANLQTVKNLIARQHGVLPNGPYQIVTDFSVTIEQIPSVPVQVWTKVADEGDVVLIKAGTTVRYGSGTAWNSPITYSVDTTVTVNNSTFGPDPIVGTAKELDQLGTAGGVARTTAN